MFRNTILRKKLFNVLHQDIDRNNKIMIQVGSTVLNVKHKGTRRVVRSNLNPSYSHLYNRKRPGMGFGNSRMVQGGDEKTRCTISKSTSTLCVPSLPHQVCQIPS